jgi:hypothetical protein
MNRQLVTSCVVAMSLIGVAAAGCAERQTPLP